MSRFFRARVALSALAVVTACKSGQPVAPPETSQPSTPPPAPTPPVNPEGQAKADPKADTPAVLPLATDLPPIPASEAWRSAIPKGATPRTPQLPTFKTKKLKNGLTVMVSSERAKLPLVSFHVVTRGGAAMDPPGQAGLTALTYAMLAEGAGKRDALAFSDAAADLGTELAAAADRDRGAVSLGGLVKNADGMMALLADAVLRPRMDAKDFERRKAQMIAALLASRGSPQGLAFEALPALVYGGEHPYGHPPYGTPESVQALTLEDVKAMLPKVLDPERSALIAVGDISMAEAEKLAERHLGKWKSSKTKLPEIAAVPAKPRSSVIIIDKAPAPQTMVMLARPIFGRGSPDEAPTTVLNEVFGGAFTSRLNMNLREDKGYTYGAGSQAQYRLGAGVFTSYAAVRADVTKESLSEFMKELSGLISRPPTAEEVDLAKAGLTRALPGAFERTGASAVAAASVFAYDLPLDYYPQLVKRYESVAPDAVKAMAEKHLDPSTMVILLVGDAATIRPGIEGLNLGKIIVQAPGAPAAVRP